MIVMLLAVLLAQAPDDVLMQMGSVKRVYVDRLTGGETAAQMRDLIISSLQGSKLFILTENPDRADAFLRGAAEDLILTAAFASSDSGDLRGAASTGRAGRSTSATTTPGRSVSVGAGEHEATNIKERKHEALATVRLVNKDGDGIWSTTQEIG